MHCVQYTFEDADDIMVAFLAFFLVSYCCEEKVYEDGSKFTDALSEARPCMYGNRRMSDGIIFVLCVWVFYDIDLYVGN